MGSRVFTNETLCLYVFFRFPTMRFQAECGNDSLPINSLLNLCNEGILYVFRQLPEQFDDLPFS